MAVTEVATHCWENPRVEGTNSDRGKFHAAGNKHLRRALGDEWAFICSGKGEGQFMKEENMAYAKTWGMVLGAYRVGRKGIDMEDQDIPAIEA